MSLAIKERLSIRFYKYFISYTILMMIILLILGSLLYGKLQEMLSDNVEEVSTSILSEVQNMTESRIKEMERIALEIPHNTKFTPYLLANGGYDSYQMVRNIRSYAAGNSFVYDIALAYSYNEEVQILNSRGSYSLADFLQRQYPSWMQGSDILQQQVISSQVPTMFPMASLAPSDKTNEKSSIYVYPLPGSSSKAPRLVLFLIRDQQFVGMVKRVFNGYEGYSFLLDQDQTLLASTNLGDLSGNSEDLLDEIIHQSPEALSIIWDNQSLSLVRVTSENNGWTYILAMPQNQFLQEAKELKRMFMLTVFGIFAFGLFLSYSFARIQYRPWRKLASAIKPNEGVQKSIRADEYSLVTRAFDFLAHENSILNSHMKTRSRLLKEKYIHHLLQGELTRMKEIEHLLDSPSFLTANPYYVVVIFKVDEYRLYEMKTRSHRELLIFGLINIVEEVIGEVGTGHCIELPNLRSVAAVININDSEDMKGILPYQARKAIEIYEQYYNQSLTAGIGSLYDSLERVGLTLREADQAAQYRYYLGGGRVITYASVKDKVSRQYIYRKDIGDRLILSLKQANRSEMEQSVREIAASLLEQSVTPEKANEVWVNITTTVMNSLYEMNEDLMEFCQGDLRHLFEDDIEQLNEVELRLIDFYNKLCHILENQRESKNTALLNQLIELVKQRYRENTISLDTIATEVSLSPSYVTRYFKDQTGYSLIQYIDMLRMEEAKKLLRTTNLKIADIIDQTGYVDGSNFRRKFRKREGMTPVQYRKLSSIKE
ncbi:AraC family transcriptional regulator [Bacillus sp. SD088]|uniref:AraC family transcriptional regulator n=1 Tax=Bacillus sp. SD088 TaxID=2782012 RepID=UPI001A9666A9|nr:AraC family transcriptional regulator [Bacillus sp. SD088]MBO0995856.1 AraC family transcriptional regulator [Bacillus sp. SD088]